MSKNIKLFYNRISKLLRWNWIIIIIFFMVFFGIFIYVQISQISKTASQWINLFDERLIQIEKMVDSNSIKIPYVNYVNIGIDGTIRESSVNSLTDIKLNSNGIYGKVQHLGTNEVKILFYPDAADGIQRVQFVKRYSDHYVDYSFEAKDFFPGFPVSDSELIMETNGVIWYSSNPNNIGDGHNHSILEIKSGKFFMTISREFKGINNSDIAIEQDITFHIMIFFIIAVCLLFILIVLKYVTKKVLGDFTLLKNEQQYLESFINTLSENVNKKHDVSTPDLEGMNWFYKDALQHRKEEDLQFEENARYFSLIKRFVDEISLLLDTLIGLNNELEKKVSERTNELEEMNTSLEEEIGQRIELEDELSTAKEKAEEVSNYKSQFVANMSHELRTPINAIIGVNQLLYDSELTQKQKKYLEKSILSSQNLLNLVNNILDFSKIEANKIELEHIPFDLKSQFCNLESMLLPTAIEKGLLLNMTIDQNIPPVLIGDPTRLFQILTNLINNAIKFTQKGCVQVDAKSEELNSETARIVFHVKDTGVGMTDQQIERIFNPFSQADTSTTRAYGGTGLGLSICKQLVKLMNGSISVESTLGKGSTFTVTIDFEYSNSNDVLIHKPLINQEMTKFKDLKVLLVEDNEMNQYIFTELLQDRGVNVDTADNGFEAVVKIEEGNQYDLILMDVHMPVMNGYDASKKIRSLNSQVPIIAITADALKDVNQKVLDSGMNGFISKPINFGEMISTMQRVLENH